MKRKAVRTEYVYRDSRYTHHCGPIEHLQRNDKCSFTVSQPVNVTRYNRIVLRREIREWQFSRQTPRLVKHAQFTNHPIEAANENQ